MSDELLKLRWALILAQAAVLGDAAAAASYGVSTRSVREWKQTLKTDEGFRVLFKRRCRELDELAVELRERRQRRAGSDAAGDDAVRRLARAVTASLSAVASACDLLPVLAVVRPRQLPPAQHPDLLLAHGAGNFTACVLLPWVGDGQVSLEQRALGRLLYFGEDARMVNPVEAERLAYLQKIRLLSVIAPAAGFPVVLADYDAGPVFARALARIGGRCFNVREVLSQNILTGGGEQAAA